MNVTKCIIADFKVAFETDIPRFEKTMRLFLDDFDTPQISVKISDDDVEFEKSIFCDPTVKIYPNTFKRAALFRKLGDILPLNNAFVLQSALLDVEGVGVAFAAHSGTGKSTHLNLWQQLLGDRMTIVNGDKPIVRFFDDEPETPYAYGSPWNGKEGLGCNMRTALKHICFIERSKTNFVEKVEKSVITDRLIKQVYMPQNPVAVMDTMMLVDRLLSCCNFWIIHCNMESEAAEVAYNTIFGAEEQF